MRRRDRPASFTGYQTLTQKDDPSGPPRDWSEAPDPAKVRRRSWRASSNGVIQESLRRPFWSGVALTGAVLGADYTLVPAMKVYDPPWRYPPQAREGPSATISFTASRWPARIARSSRCSADRQ